MELSREQQGNMKFSLLVLLLFVGSLLQVQGFIFKKNIAGVQCLSQHRIPPHDVENIKNRKMPESKEGKCFMACVLKQLNVINGEGKFEVKTVKGWMDEKYKENTHKLSRAYARAESCAEKLPAKITDECEYAAKILECSRQKKSIRN